MTKPESAQLSRAQLFDGKLVVPDNKRAGSFDFGVSRCHIFQSCVYFFPLSDLRLLSYLTTGIGQDEREKLYEGEIM